ncbi:MAG: hypothetical protein JO112_15430, partial [Planctomycetes bacterium]|nr:hypothetical protein [Planctomycetota bacterium]
MLAGGALANGVLALLALLLWGLWPQAEGVWWMAAGLNGLLCFVNLVPFASRIGKFTLRSDGAQILRLLRRDSLGLPAPLQIRITQELGGLWEAIGDTVALGAFLRMGALAWMEIGVIDQAEELCAQAEALPNSQPADRALRDLVRGLIASEAGKLETSAQALKEAE